MSKPVVSPFTDKSSREHQLFRDRGYYWKRRDFYLTKMRKYRLDHHQKEQDRKHKVVVKRRQKMLDEYGNKCARCGFSDVRALQIDHVKGGNGWKEKRASLGYFKRVMKHDGEFQLLCANCNWIKRHEEKENRNGR